MADGIIITPGDLYSAGRQVLEAQTQLQAIVDTLSNGVNQYGVETWGNDSYGRNFADDSNGNPGYVSSRTNLLSGGNNMATAIGEFGTGMTTAANNASTGEDNSASSF
jgi:hypothetical protein